MNDTTIAIDLAKSVFEVGISERPGKLSKNHRLSREELKPFLAQQPQATIIMEACSSRALLGTILLGVGARSEAASASGGASLRAALENRPR